MYVLSRLCRCAASNPAVASLCTQNKICTPCCGLLDPVWYAPDCFSFISFPITLPSLYSTSRPQFCSSKTPDEISFQGSFSGFASPGRLFPLMNWFASSFHSSFWSSFCCPLSCFIFLRTFISWYYVTFVHLWISFFFSCYNVITVRPRALFFHCCSLWTCLASGKQPINVGGMNKWMYAFSHLELESSVIWLYSYSLSIMQPVTIPLVF